MFWHHSNNESSWRHISLQKVVTFIECYDSKKLCFNNLERAENEDTFISLGFFISRPKWIGKLLLYMTQLLLMNKTIISNQPTFFPLWKKAEPIIYSPAKFTVPKQTQSLSTWSFRVHKETTPLASAIKSLCPGRSHSNEVTKAWLERTLKHLG